MFQLLPVFLGLFDSTVQKLMNGFRDIFYELAYSNLSNMLSINHVDTVSLIILLI